MRERERREKRRENGRERGARERARKREKGITTERQTGADLYTQTHTHTHRRIRESTDRGREGQTESDRRQ